MSETVQTPTETLMAALAECETADNVLIIMRHKGCISWHHTMGCVHEMMGLLEFALTVSKAELMRDVMNDEDEDEDEGEDDD